MIEVVKTPYNTADTFFRNLGASKDIIRLCAPYIKKDIVDKILDIKADDSSLMVVTSSNLPVFATGGSDLEAIKILLENGVQVYNYQDLHAKVYMFDDIKAIVTSANLTYSGFYKNYEYGLILDEKDTIKQFKEDFVDMIQSDECGEFDVYKVGEISNMLSRMSKIPSITLTDDGEPLLSMKDILEATSNLNGWKKDVFSLILQIKTNQFSLDDLKLYSNKLKELHPNNNYIDAKVRQVLQQLRDLGLIRFTKRGHYLKLWVE